MEKMEKKRKHIRFHAEEDTFITVKLEDDSLFTGLCLSESQGGCSGVFVKSDHFMAGKMGMVKVGKLDPLSAEIRWVTELDSEVIKVGFHFLSLDKVD